MKRLFLLIVLFLPLSCKKTASTPEEAFKMFSLAAGMAQPAGMERYGEKTYVKELQDRFDLLALLAAFWPKEVVIVKSEAVTGVATLQVQGINAAGKTVQGTFQLRQQDGGWKVFAGDWQNLSGQEPEEAPAAEPGFQPAVPEGSED
jgi:hypothetical protein